MQINLNNPNEFTLPNVKRLIASASDDTPTQIRVTRDGVAYLSLPPETGNAQTENLAFRLETFTAKGYVGAVAASDNSWVFEIYATLRNNWPNPISSYIEFFSSHVEAKSAPKSVPSLDLAPPSPAPAVDGMADDDAVEVIIDWFYANFEDPVHSTPHDSEEGGHIYVWGGPYDAEEELYSAFSSAKDDLVERASKEIGADGIWEWAPNQSRIYQVDSEESSSDTTSTLLGALLALETSLNQLPSHPRGHNNPPEPVDVQPLSASELAQIREAITHFRKVSTEAEISADSQAKSKSFISSLQKAGTTITEWLLSKANLGVDGFVSTIGKVAGASSVVWIIGQWNTFMTNLYAAADAATKWLEIATSAF